MYDDQKDIELQSPKNKITDYFEVLEIEEDKLKTIEILRRHFYSIKVDHNIEIMKKKTLKDAHIYCIENNISSQIYGPLLERYIREKYGYLKNKISDCNGDMYKNGKNIEIKTSLGGKEHNKFNFVQIRPFHKCDYYILTCYHLCADNIDQLGQLYIFYLTESNMIEILLKHGQYAHGTMNQHGPITIENLLNKEKLMEYSLRPKFGDSCWNDLLKYRTSENQL